VSNSTAYGASGATLERKIESDVGEAPEPGTGDGLLEALMARQPRAFEFMLEMEKMPEKPGYIVAASGRVRHFHLHDRNQQDWWAYKSQLSPQSREARNFPMQESVAATACRAAVWLLEFGTLFGLKGYPIAVLYDSVVTMCPCEERDIWRKAHDLFMWLGNGWAYEDRTLRYPVDHELNKRWSRPMAAEREVILSVPLGTEPRHVEAEAWLDRWINRYKKDERMSCLGMGWAMKQLRQERNA
jgi:hypothetical protein